VRNGRDEAVLSQARYANGLTTYLPVLSASASLIDAQRDQAESTARTQAALASLYKTLGEDLSSPGSSAIAP
jgi:outer membrane protein TolC